MLHIGAQSAAADMLVDVLSMFISPAETVRSAQLSTSASCALVQEGTAFFGLTKTFAMGQACDTQGQKRAGA
jgi:hypothetical protein